MDETQPKPRVSEALVPSQYRVYPNTPLDEVVDLMVRRSLHAVPVVGEQFEVLGIITSGDALAHLLSWGPKKDEDPPAESREGKDSPPETQARDVMTRSVLCVSEDQPLPDAANMLVNRDVEQLPVVREGEFVGFITRDSVLKTLGGFSPEEDHNEPQER